MNEVLVSNSANLDFVFSSGGIYNINLVAFGNGCSDNVVFTVIVTEDELPPCQDPLAWKFAITARSKFVRLAGQVNQILMTIGS